MLTQAKEYVVQDSLTIGLLHRIDALAAKMGMAGDQLWALWLSTWWRPCIGPVACLVYLAFAWRPFVRLCDELDKAGMYEAQSAKIARMVLLAVLGMVAIISTIITAPDALTYAFNHQLYALDQLRGILGK